MAKRIAGIACLVLAAVLALAAVSSLSGGNGPAINDASGLGVSRAVGAFLLPMTALIVGLWLLKKPKPNGRAAPGAAPDGRERRSS